jgi:uncharacterized membrane-anchored protein
MTPQLKKGLVVAAVHLAMVGSLGVKLLVDRATRPRVWARAAPIDPDDPLRGRYVRLRVEGTATELGKDSSGQSVGLAARDGMLALVPTSEDSRLTARVSTRNGERTAILEQPLAFFIPEHVPDPSVRAPGEELWVEVTLPKQGPPRPIRLAVKKDGVLTALALD